MLAQAHEENLMMRLAYGHSELSGKVHLTKWLMGRPPQTKHEVVGNATKTLMRAASLQKTPHSINEHDSKSS